LFIFEENEISLKIRPQNAAFTQDSSGSFVFYSDSKEIIVVIPDMERCGLFLRNLNEACSSEM
jgi:hypothetical protein